MKLEPLIGLEIHIQLKTKSKMFCACDNAGENLPPNTTICPICVGEPGALPAPNNEAIAAAVKTALFLNCRVNPTSKFDRKHYFYPDLPKGYQISQYDMPIAEGGFLEIESFDENGQAVLKRINLMRLHLEEDAAKNVHGGGGSTCVDYNRAGTPLVEIVTKPDIKTPAEAKNFLQELHTAAQYLDISYAEMEKGHLRCDVNISLRPAGDGNFYPKTEIKNLNSFRAVERALEYEIKRQTKLWEEGNPPKTLATRGWDDAKQVTEEQRVKEEAQDYRYFPEPDIPPFGLKKIAEKIKNLLPEPPLARRYRFVNEFGLSVSDARILAADPRWADFTERVFTECWEWLVSLPEMSEYGTEDEIIKKNAAKVGRLAGGWLTSKLMGLTAENKIDIRILKISPENFAEFLSLVYTNKIGSANALRLLEEMLIAGEDPSQIMEEKKLGQVKDEKLLERAADEVIRMNPEQATQYKAGKLPIIQFLVGKMMKETEGKIDPQAARKILEEKLR